MRQQRSSTSPTATAPLAVVLFLHVLVSLFLTTVIVEAITDFVTEQTPRLKQTIYYKDLPSQYHAASGSSWGESVDIRLPWLAIGDPRYDEALDTGAVHFFK